MLGGWLAGRGGNGIKKGGIVALRRVFGKGLGLGIGANLKLFKRREGG